VLPQISKVYSRRSQIFPFALFDMANYAKTPVYLGGGLILKMAVLFVRIGPGYLFSQIRPD
jgi:hypothetical protein